MHLQDMLAIIHLSSMLRRAKPAGLGGAFSARLAGTGAENANLWFILHCGGLKYFLRKFYQAAQLLRVTHKMQQTSLAVVGVWSL